MENLWSFKIYFFLYIYFVCIYVYHIHAGAHIDKKGASNPLELELEALWTAMWGQGLKPKSYARVQLFITPQKCIHVFFS